MIFTFSFWMFLCLFGEEGRRGGRERGGRERMRMNMSHYVVNIGLELNVSAKLSQSGFELAELHFCLGRTKCLILQTQFKPLFPR